MQFSRLFLSILGVALAVLGSPLNTQDVAADSLGAPSSITNRASLGETSALSKRDTNWCFNGYPVVSFAAGADAYSSYYSHVNDVIADDDGSVPAYGLKPGPGACINIWQTAENVVVYLCNDNTFALDVGYDVVRSMYYALAEDCQANGNMQGQVFSELKFNVLMCGISPSKRDLVPQPELATRDISSAQDGLNCGNSGDRISYGAAVNVFNLLNREYQLVLGPNNPDPGFTVAPGPAKCALVAGIDSPDPAEILLCNDYTGVMTVPYLTIINSAATIINSCQDGNGNLEGQLFNGLWNVIVRKL